MARWFIGITTYLAVALLSVDHAHASLITNGDFETGDFTGWTLFVTQFGGIVAPAVVPFDTNGDLVTSFSGRFDVGQVGGPCGIGLPCPTQGGGIFQSFATGAGQLAIDLDIASQSGGNNAAGGLFTLFLDGAQVDSFNFGDIFVGTIERAHLTATPTVLAGFHELRIQIERNAGIVDSFPGLHHYVDDVVVTGPAAVPEPSTLLLLGAGLGAARLRFRRRKK